MTSPDEIRNRTFRVAARGYDRIEVATYLARVALELEAALAHTDAATTIDLREPVADSRPLTVVAASTTPPGARPSSLPPPVPVVAGEPAPEPEAVPVSRHGVDQQVVGVSAAPVEEPVPIVALADDDTAAAAPPAAEPVVRPPSAGARAGEESSFPDPAGFGRQVAEMLRRAKADAAAVRARAEARAAVADRQVADARDRAVVIVADAQRQAADIVADAEREAAAIRRRAELDAEERLATAAREAAATRDDLDASRATICQALSEVRSYLDAALQRAAAGADGPGVGGERAGVRPTA